MESKSLIQNVSLIMLKNFIYHYHLLFIRFMFKGLKEWFGDMISKKQQNDVIHDVIYWKWGVIWEIQYFQNVSLLMLNNFSHPLHFEKNISKCFKQHSSDTITKNHQYDAYKWRHVSGMGHGMKIIFFSKCPSNHV